ncbi:hypothetical protein [Halohasta litorea]|uniref:Gamma-glutamyl:cysteine ligase YbdK, ATP-grasp superfamily n=1 Tax=Halohasta litorea TaxID=869891 RepID=A0ABD6D9D1_9EURY|nr:hypothetical protein [Halohasta litorea]
MDSVVATVRRALDDDTQATFDRRVAEQADRLRAELDRGAFDSSGFAVGLELELYAVGGTGALTRIDETVFADRTYTREIGRHNVELNASPQRFDSAGVEAQSAELRAAVGGLQETLSEHGQQAILDGMWTIPPTEGSLSYLDSIDHHGDIRMATNMPAKPRYCAMDNTLRRAADGAIEITVPGADHRFSTILVESLTTSIQPHLQVPDTDRFPTYFNAAVRTLGPVLALSTNSPFLPGDLYNAVEDPQRLVAETPHELRIPIFEGTVNVGDGPKACCPRDIETPTDIVDRVVDDWTCGPFLSEWAETPTDETAAAVEPYWEFTHKYGTYWRWVRPILGGDAAGDGGSLRIEYRPLPTQPTVQDVLSLHWLTTGLVRGIVAADHPLVELDWTDAEGSFYNAVDDGLDAELSWITTDGEPTSDPQEIYPDLFDLARRGLREQGLGDGEIERLLAPMVDRWERRATPSQWKKARVREELDSGASLTGAIAAMQTDYIAHSQRGEPFADW